MSDNSILELETLNKEYDITLHRYNKVMNDFIQMTQAENESSTTQCSADYGKTKPCCGNPADEVEAKYPWDLDPQHICQSGAPICKDYIAGSQWGTCHPNKRKEKHLLILIEQLNDKLTDLANQVDSIEADLEPDMIKSFIKTKKESVHLNANLKELHFERKKIKHALAQLNELNEETDHTDLNASSNYWGYVLLIIIMLICILGIVALGAFSKKTTPQLGGKFLRRTR